MKFAAGATHPKWKGGRSLHPLYNTWRGMIRRCEDPGHLRWQHYGGRGIYVCESWHDFWRFVADVGEGPPGHTLDRIDVNGNYTPGNIRWATWAEQNANRQPVFHGPDLPDF